MPSKRDRSRIFHRLVLFSSGAVALACAMFPMSTGSAAAAGQMNTSVWEGISTEAQARRGEQVFKTECSYCHNEDLSGGFFDDGLGRAPALAGKRAFDSSMVERWGGLTLADMVATVAATMPRQRPASLSASDYADVVSYLLF